MVITEGKPVVLVFLYIRYLPIAVSDRLLEMTCGMHTQRPALRVHE